MSLIYQLQQLQAVAKQMEEDVTRKQHDFSHLVNDLVRWRQECRLAKDYATADRIRLMLADRGVEIIPGSIGLPQGEWGNRQHHDTWRQAG